MVIASHRAEQLCTPTDRFRRLRHSSEGGRVGKLAESAEHLGQANTRENEQRHTSTTSVASPPTHQLMHAGSFLNSADYRSRLQSVLTWRFDRRVRLREESTDSPRHHLDASLDRESPRHHLDASPDPESMVNRVGKCQDEQRPANTVCLFVPPRQVRPSLLRRVQLPQATLQLESDST